MDHYTLYLDESETFTSSGRRFFTVGGVIVQSSIAAKLSQELDLLKSSLWDVQQGSTTNILHEREITMAQRNQMPRSSCYYIFKRNAKVKELYNGLSRILKTYHVVTLGVCLDVSRIVQLYGTRTNSKLTIALQLLLENYCHFLMTRSGTGDICYESLQEPGNQELRQRFYELEVLGTMYYTPYFFQTHIGDISFKSKADNVPGLQLADFIPNTLARQAAKLSPKHKQYKQTVLKQLYDGDSKNAPKYGFQIIP